MKQSSKILALSTLMVALSSCTYVDDYMLGKDNTPEPKPLSMITPKTNLVKKWSVPIGKETNIATLERTKPVVNQQVIYAVSNQGIIKAMKESDGSVIWQAKLPQPIVSGPTVAGKYLAVTTSDAKLHLYQKQDGHSLWQVQLSNDMLAKPLITHGQVIAKTVDGMLVSYDAKNGQRQWSIDHGAPDIILKASASPVLVNNQYILSAFSDGKVEAINIANGRSLWQGRIAFPKGGSDIEQLVDVDADPVIENNMAYVATFQGVVGALSLQTGQFKWRRPASVFKDIVIDSQSVYYVDSDDIVWSLHKQNGRVNWKQKQLEHRGLSSPVILGNQLFLTDKSGILHGLSARTGMLTARVNAQAKSAIGPVVADAGILVETASGQLSRYSVS